MITLAMFLEENSLRYPILKRRKFVILDKKGKFLRFTNYDGLDFSEKEMIEMYDLPNELVDDVYLIKLKISKRRYWKLMER